MTAHPTPGDAAAFLRERIGFRPRVALVLGSGLGDTADALDAARRVPYVEIPGFPPPGVAGHRGVVVAGTLEGVPCLALQGRYHLYEGHLPDVVGFPTRTALELGTELLVVTNAAGGLNRTFRAGDLMLLDDHINLLWNNPLIGAQSPGETRFPDMSAPYDGGLQQLALDTARELRIRLVRGVYVALLGPSYETPAEVRMLQRLGGDAVGMSTVPEVLVARARGIPVLGFSLVTNPATGLTPQPLTHEEVMQAGAAAAQTFTRLLRGILGRLPARPSP